MKGPRDTDFVAKRAGWSCGASTGATLSKNQIAAALHWGSGQQVSPYEFALMVEGSPQSRDVVELGPEQAAIAELYFRVGDAVAQRSVGSLSLYRRCASGEGLPPGFVEAGFLAMRLDAVGRSTDQGVSRIDVSMTALNTQADRRGLQYNDKSFVLVTTDGSEYRGDGNTYGASSADRLVNTVWLEKDEQAQVTYVYHVPADRTPNRLSIREGGREIAGLDLAGAKGQRAAATEQKATEGGTAMGQAAALGRFEVTLDKVQRDAEGAWEALVTVKNVSSATERLHINDLTLALYGQDGQARNMNGQFYDHAAGPRRLVESGMTLAAGAQTRFRLYFPESAGMTPVRYRVREREGQAAEGPVTR